MRNRARWEPSSRGSCELCRGSRRADGCELAGEELSLHPVHPCFPMKVESRHSTTVYSAFADQGSHSVGCKKTWIKELRRARSMARIEHWMRKSFHSPPLSPKQIPDPCRDKWCELDSPAHHSSETSTNIHAEVSQQTLGKHVPTFQGLTFSDHLYKPAVRKPFPSQKLQNRKISIYLNVMTGWGWVGRGLLL